jgi:hypothetical protein
VSSENESFGDRFSDQVRKKALEMFELQPETKAEEFDYAGLFNRILSDKDWTDKLESVVVKIRNRFHIRNTDTKLSEELKALIPDMKEVAKAYDEMTNGYKAFIQTVLDAKQARTRRTLRKTDPSSQRGRTQPYHRR